MTFLEVQPPVPNSRVKGVLPFSRVDPWVRAYFKFCSRSLTGSPDVVGLLMAPFQSREIWSWGNFGGGHERIIVF